MVVARVLMLVTATIMDVVHIEPLLVIIIANRLGVGGTIVRSGKPLLLVACHSKPASPDSSN
jgi:hypothetical protein